MALGCLRHLDLKAHATFAQFEHKITKDSQNYILTTNLWMFEAFEDKT